VRRGEGEAWEKERLLRRGGTSLEWTTFDCRGSDRESGLSTKGIKEEASRFGDNGLGEDPKRKKGRPFW